MENGEEGVKQGKLASHWVVMTRRLTDLGKLAQDPRWKVVKSGRALWTDDYCNLLSAFRWN